MNLHDKVEYFRTEMQQRGLAGATPPLFRLLWRCGIEVTPPHFIPFWQLALMTGALFSLVTIVGLWLLNQFWPEAAPIPFSVGKPVFFGVLFGLVFAGRTRQQARQHGLPPRWEDYPVNAGTPTGNQRA